MDAFEKLVGEVLWHSGYWVQQSVKVDLTPEDKKAIGKHSLPRSEIDLVAYNGKTEELLLIECKSYLDSGGASIDAFNGRNLKFAERFKLFNQPKLWKIVSKRFVAQYSSKGLFPSNIKPKLGLVAGKIKGEKALTKEKNREDLKNHFLKAGWFFRDELWLRDELTERSESSYENSIAMVTAKILIRGKLAK